MKGVAAQDGASLVEQLVAIALIGLVLVTLLYGLSGALLGVGVVDERSTAANLATSALEVVKRSPFITDTLTYTPAIVVPQGYRVQVTASTITAGLQLITASVYHNERLLWQLEGYKVNR